MNAYIDESGNCDINLNHQGATPFYIITAILLNDTQNEKIREDLDSIAHKYFSGSQIKSSSVGSDDKRRLMILEEISKLDFSMYSLVVDKEKLFSKGFQYKTSFFKFLNGKIHSELYKSIPDLIVYHDSYGTDEYMISFKEYIQKNHTHDLFSRSDFYMVNSQDFRQIQLADFICGAVNRIYDKTKSQEFEKNYRQLISRINGFIDEWPLDDAKIDLDNTQNKDEDILIEKVAIHTVNEYLGKYENNKEPIINHRVLFLRYLLYSYKYFNKNKFIYTHELRNHLSINGVHVSDYYIRSSIVAPLRDHGVLISSSSKGYKIPISKLDVINYIQHSNSIISPMVSRLKNVQKVILLGSGGEIDIYNDGYGFPDCIVK